MDKGSDQGRMEIGNECLKLISKTFGKKINHEKYYIELLNLHKKYPMQGHNTPLTKFQINNYKKIKTVKRIKQDPKFKDLNEDVIYEDNIQPLNFQEAAEMYIRNNQKGD